MLCTTQGKCLIEKFEGNILAEEDLLQENLLDLYKNYYEEMMKDYQIIFPDLNRNSGGVQFFNYLYSKRQEYTKQKFDILNKFYCGVSGSVIYPERILTFKDNKYIFEKKNNASDFVMIKDLNNNFKCGFYYRCCIPCCSDIMNYDQVNVRVEDFQINLKDGNYNYSVLTIPDPCKKSIKINNEEYLVDPDPDHPDQLNITNPKWREVSSFKCENKSTVNGIKTNSGRLIFAILFDGENCNESSFIANNYYNSDLMEYHEKRKNSDKSNEGMGKIFIQLSNF